MIDRLIYKHITDFGWLLKTRYEKQGQHKFWLKIGFATIPIDLIGLDD